MRALLSSAIVATALLSSAAATKNDGDDVAALQREVSELKQQVKWLMQQQAHQPAFEEPPQQQEHRLAVSAGPKLPLSVATFGAKADGSTDDTAAFQAALTAAKMAGHAVVSVPAGTYKILGHLTVPSNCELRGDNHFPYRSWGSGSGIPVGTTLQVFAGANCTQPSSTDANSTCHPFILLQGSNAAVSGMSIVYPQQAGPQAAAPVPYPWTIRGSGDDCTVKNVFLVNSYLGIDMGTLPAGRHLVENVYGNPLKTGIFVDNCFDVGRIRHIHFWCGSVQPRSRGLLPALTTPRAALCRAAASRNFWCGRGPEVVGPLQQWVSANGATIVLARTDWEVVEDVFSWGYARGLKLITSDVVDPETNISIGASNGQCTDVQFDAVDIGVEVQSTDPYGWFFSNLNLANAGWGKNALGIACDAACAANVVVRGASFWGAFHQAVSWNGTSAFFSISDSTVENCAHQH